MYCLLLAASSSVDLLGGWAVGGVGMCVYSVTTAGVAMTVMVTVMVSC